MLGLARRDSRVQLHTGGARLGHDSVSVYQSLLRAGQRWRDQHALLMTAIGGMHIGLNALGGGSKTKRVERAARLDPTMPMRRRFDDAAF